MLYFFAVSLDNGLGFVGSVVSAHVENEVTLFSEIESETSFSIHPFRRDCVQRYHSFSKADCFILKVETSSGWATLI